MKSVSRSTQFAKLHKVLKKHYAPVAPDAKRPVLEHLLFACLLEDAQYAAAESAFAALVHNLFDWNEVRVTSISELCELMSALPDPRAAGQRIKRVLQSVFETAYSFELEELRKKSLGPTVKWLERLDGVTPFAVSYVVQAALGGHQIPLDQGTLAVLRVVDLASDKDVTAGSVSGLERAIAKSKGIEFGSLLHQLGADFVANPYSPRLRGILLEVDPNVADRMPKRRAPVAKEKEPAAPKESGKAAASGETAKGDATKAEAARRAAGGKKKPEAKPSPTVKSKEEVAAAKPAAKKKAAGEPPKAKAVPKAAAGKGEAARRKSGAAGLAKRKPR